MSLLAVAGTNSASGDYDIANSLKLEADNTEYMYRTMTSTGNRRTFTLSVWLKRTEVGDTGNAFGHTFFQGGNAGTGTSVLFRFGTSTNTDQLRLQFVSDTQISVTNRVFRDTSAWYHIVVAVDTTQATASDRWKLYVNGVQETSFASSYYPTQNADTQNNYSVSSTYSQEVGAYVSGGTAYGHFNGYMAEYNHIDGQQLEPTDFGEFDSDTGIWKPKAYTGSYGTNGFYLDFESSGSLGAYSSGNGNNFTLSNITSVDQATDTPTNNFCTLNPLIYYGYPCTISQGAVKASDNSVGLGGAAGTFAVNKGKWYWEFQTNGANTIVGVQNIEAPTQTNNNAHEYAYTMGLYLLGEYNFVFDTSGRNDGAVSGFVHANANFYGIALNMDDNEIEYYVNGVQKGPTFSLDGLSDLYLRPFASSSSSILYFNFGGLYPDPISTGNADANGYGNFEYAPPTGYYALCTKNLAEFG